MSLITSPELFINVKRVPPKTSSEYRPFFKEEKRKIKYGVTINGVHIPGWLYWHINHWYLDIDTPDPLFPQYINRDTRHPDLRDNEWMIGEAIQEVETTQSGLLI